MKWETDIKKVFESKFIKNHNNGCWIWIGAKAKSRGGYGKLTCRPAGIVEARAHRLSWKLYRDETITENDHVLHKCDTVLCVNPDHLFVGDQKVNMEDKSYKGRQLQGKKHPKYIHGKYVGQKQQLKYHSGKENPHK